jgi:hypothetical protein
MLVRRALTILSITLLAVSCSDVVGVHSVDQRNVGPVPHFLRWDGGSAPRMTVLGSVRKPTGEGIAASAPFELSLEHNSASFWSVRGAERSIQINYQGADGSTAPFLKLTTTDPRWSPEQGDIAEGDSVLITVSVDPENIKVTLEPTGLQFGDPAHLEVSYDGASGDLNGDGVVDASDSFIENQLLGMWYREASSDPWAPIPNEHSLADKSFTSSLPHFCEYAVSW